MRFFTRFALAATTIALTLSGCADDQPVASDATVGLPEMIDICGEPEYAQSEYYELNLDGTCAKVNKHYDPTTQKNRALYEYMISDERHDLLQATYAPAAQTLLQKMLNGEIPSKLVSGNVRVLKRSMHVVRDEHGEALYEPLPANGWGWLISDFPKDDFGGTSGTVRMTVRVTNGKLDTSVEPIDFSFDTRRGSVSMNGPFLIGRNDELVPNTMRKHSWGHYMWDGDHVRGHVVSISMIDYVHEKQDYYRQTDPDDRDITVVLDRARDPITGELIADDTPEAIRLLDTEFAQVLNEELGMMDGSYWK